MDSQMESNDQVQPKVQEGAIPPAMPELLVEVKDLCRSFGGFKAVDHLNFNIYRGQVVGFIGANGAGKTTTMRIMATLDTQSSGSVKIHGLDTIEYPDKVKHWIGWMPDYYGTYQHMTVLEYLDFFARAYGLKGAKRKERLMEIMAFADLTQLAERPMNTLSKGMGQRLCFGRMLIPDPDLLILDEPAAGLDPKARIEFKNLIRILAKRGKTIFISSHILSELAEMCDTMLFIDGGKLVYHGSADSLQHRHSLHAEAAPKNEVVFDVGVLGEVKVLLQWAENQPNWELVDERKNGARLRLMDPTPERMAEGLKRMVLEGIPVISFHRESRKLEDAFVEILTKPKAL